MGRPTSQELWGKIVQALRWEDGDLAADLMMDLVSVLKQGGDVPCPDPIPSDSISFD